MSYRGREDIKGILRTHLRQAVAAQPPFVKRARVGLLNLSSNELLHPDITELLELFASEISRCVHLARYPVFDEAMDTLCAAVRLPRGCCALSPGSDAAIRALIETFSGARKVITLVPCYRSYEDYTVVFGSEFVGVESHPEQSALARLISAIRRSNAAVIVLTNPDGVTGHLWDLNQAAELASEATQCGSLLIIDEAYAAFAPIDHTALLADHPNVLIIRSYSKSHGAAGIRLAAVFAGPDFIDNILRTRVSNGLSSVAIAFLRFILANEGKYKRLLDDIVKWRVLYEQRLRLARPGWDVAWSRANFIFSRLPSLSDAEALQTELKRIGVEVRAIAMKGELPIAIRATVAAPALMERAMAILVGDAS